MKLFGLGRKTETAVEERVAADDAAECPHTALTPRWDSLDDMGSPEKVSSYFCDACEQTFRRDEGERLMEQAADRLRVAEMQSLKD